MWEKEDLLTIIKYERYKRNKAILSSLWDLNARPHEVTLLKVKHIRLKEKYGEGEIPHEAKTGTGPVLLTTSFVYVRDWLNEHPFKNEPEARLICNLNNGSSITPDNIHEVMKQLRRRIIRLLENGEINNEVEREKLEYLLKTKKWNPYCVRHSSITADSDYLPEYALKKKVRWSMNSKQGIRDIKRRMRNDLKQKILEYNGITPSNELQKRTLIPQCPRCEFTNAFENKYCSKCSYPLVPEAYDEIKEKQETRIKKMEKQILKGIKINVSLRKRMGNGFYWMILSTLVMLTIIGSAASVHSIKNTDSNTLTSPQSNKNITITLQFAASNETNVFPLVDNAADKLRSNHPDLDIHVKYFTTDYNNYRNQTLKALINGTSIDVVSLDQIWLDEFAQKHLLTDLTNYTKKWGHLSDWYESNRDGMTYNGSIYGIWAWTDIRGMWYWKDLLNEAGVDPKSLETWDGYIEAAKKLNTVLRPQGIEGVHLTGASHSPDLWYPYLWMLGGDIIGLKSGHPSKGTYWFPTYNNTEGVKAMQFIKNQVNAGISPQKNHSWGEEFANRKFAVMLEGPWVSGYFPHEQWSSLKQRVGFIPLFPVPSLDNKTSALMGGWEFSIPSTSSNKNLAWELIEFMLEPQILTPWIAEEIYLPTQISLGEGNGSYANFLRKSIPFYDDMISLIPLGKGRPSIPEYPAIADDIRGALDDVYHGIKEPKQALNDAATKSAKTLGW